jgi:hypothetical protein
MMGETVTRGCGETNAKVGTADQRGEADEEEREYDEGRDEDY